MNGKAPRVCPGAMLTWSPLTYCQLPVPRQYRPLVEVRRFQKATAQNVRSRQHISSPAHRGPRTGHHPRSSPQPKPLSATKSCKSLRRRALKSIESSAGYSQIHSCSSCTMTLRSKFSLRGAAGRTGSFSVVTTSTRLCRAHLESEFPQAQASPPARYLPRLPCVHARCCRDARQERDFLEQERSAGNLPKSMVSRDL